MGTERDNAQPQTTNYVGSQMSPQIVPHPTDPRFIDLTGHRYSEWIVISYAGKHNKARMWNCSCSCGTVQVVRGGNLASGQTRQCNDHRRSNSLEYKIWETMRQRCINPNDHKYHRYGGRGIRVCARWDVAHVFISDMGPRPSPNHSIDRINNDGNYEPGNCQWATKSEQAINQGVRSDNTSGTKGVSFNKRDATWRSYIQRNNKLCSLGNFKTKAEAISARKAAEITTP